MRTVIDSSLHIRANTTVTVPKLKSFSTVYNDAYSLDDNGTL